MRIPSSTEGAVHHITPEMVGKKLPNSSNYIQESGGLVEAWEQSRVSYKFEAKPIDGSPEKIQRLSDRTANIALY